LPFGGDRKHKCFTLIQKQMKSTNDQIKHSTANDGKPPVVCRYYHPCVGYGDFVREYNGLYGLGLIIKLDNGREWFAPINEFTRVR